MHLTDDDIIRATGDSSFRRGAAYQRQGNVKSVSMDDRGQVSAMVQGSAATRYRQKIALSKASSGRIAIEGDCTCPVGLNCKHVAAALLEGRRRGLFVEGISTDRGAIAPAGMPRAQAVATKPVPPPVEAPAVELAPEIARWLSDLEKSTLLPDEDFASDIGQRLFYILGQGHVGSSGRTGALALKLQSARLNKSGTLAPAASEFQTSNVYMPNPPKYLLAADHRIVREALRQAAQMGSRLDLVLSGEEGAGLLQAILATGRARWTSIDGPTLSAGPERRGTLAWGPGEDATLVPSLRLDEGHGETSSDVIVMAAQPPVYVAPSVGLIGPVETGLAPRLVHRILSAPPLSIDQARLVSARLEIAGGALSKVSRPTLEAARIVREKPVPVLRLRRDAVPDPSKDWAGHYYGYLRPLDLEVGRADMSFLYAGVEIPAGEPGSVAMRLKGLQPFEIHRQPKAEQAAIGRLADMGFSTFTTLYPSAKIKGAKPLGFAGSAQWCQFVYADAPTLRQEGWIVEIAADFPFQVVRGDGAFEAKVSESSGIDWFEFDLAILVDGERIDLIEPLVTAIMNVQNIGEMVTALAAEDGTLSLRLDPKRFLTLPAAKLKPYIDTLLQLLSGFAFEGKAQKLRFSALDAAHLAGLEDATGGTSAIWQGGDRVRALGARLKEAGRIPDVALPPTFRAQLRPYQARGVAWLDFLRSVELGGILADDMGLGKTIQALALIALERRPGV